MPGRNLVLYCTIAITVGLASTFASATAIRDNTARNGKEESAVSGAIAARWKSGTVKADELKEYAISKAGMAMRHGRELTQEGIRNLLDELIGQKLLLQAAGDRKLMDSPAYRNSLAILSAKEVADRYVKEVLGERLAVTDEEVDAVLPERNEVVRIKHVIVPTEEEARGVLEKIRAGMPFDEAIERYSTVRTAPGAFVDVRDTEDYLDKEVRAKILDLSQGEVSGILPMKIGYGVVLAIEKRVMDREERDRLAGERKRAIFQRKIGEHVDALRRKIGIEVNGKELMLAADEDYEFGKPHRPVLTVAGKQVYFDDYVRTRDVHLRDALKIRSPADLYSAYRVELENVGIAMALAEEATSETGWKGADAGNSREIREKLALRVLGEELFAGNEVKEDEVSSEYRENRKAFTVERRYKVRRLTFSTREEAVKFRGSVKTPEEFYRQLRQRETREDRYRNTFYEWQDDNQLDEKTKSAFDAAGKGKLTGVLSIGESIHYVYFVDEVEKNHLIPYEQVRVKIKRELLRRMQEKKLVDYVNVLRKREAVRISVKTVEAVRSDLNGKRLRISPGHGEGGIKR